MGDRGGFFKGEQKKKKKGEGSQFSGFAPVFVPPKIIERGKREK